VYIPDLVAALCACAVRDEARNEVFNIGFGGSLPIVQAATRIQEYLGGGPIDFQPWPPDYEAVESGDFVLDVGKARSLLDYAPAFDFDRGIADVRARARAPIPVSAAIG
jgi:nucleoside-diphosphate-sugar epimerase